LYRPAGLNVSLAVEPVPDEGVPPGADHVTFEHEGL